MICAGGMLVGAYCCCRILKNDKLPLLAVAAIAVYVWLVRKTVYTDMIAVELLRLSWDFHFLDILVGWVFQIATAVLIGLVIRRPWEANREVFRVLMGSACACFVLPGITVGIAGEQNAIGQGDWVARICSICGGSECS